MVRLKACLLRFFSDIFLFQFLMVRLKECRTSEALQCCLSFQFLMVRLKELNLTAPTSGYLISIPYGSIKSVLRHIPRANEQISIPYGSIKRGVGGGLNDIYNKFQFLMVRLKVCFQFLFIINRLNFNSLWFD